MINIKDLLSGVKLTSAAATPKKPYTGKYPDVSKIKRGYFKLGDKGAEITKLQNYLNWYTNGTFCKKCGKPDGVYGKNTLKYVKKMQKKFFGAKAADGTVGKKTITKMKAYSDSFKPKPTPTPTPGKSYTGTYPDVNRTDKLVDKAIELAWKKGTSTSKYTYPSGSATSAFKTALNKVYPEHKNWGKAPSVGASCDVFVGTVIRSAGLDSKFPRGLQEQESYKPSWCTRNSYKNIAPMNKAQYGDIIMFNYGNGGHVVILGKNCYYEANYQTYFGHTNSSLSRLKSKQDEVWILRPKNYLAKGDSGTEVKRLQKYLDWYFDGAFVKECGEPDGVFGANTNKYVKKMQTDFFGKDQADGTVGKKTIEAMKKVKK